MASRAHRARVLVGIAVLGAAAAQGHHSGAVFDLGTIVDLNGVVVEFKLRSPHASFVVDVPDGGEPGEGVTRWEVEWESVPMLKTLAIDGDTFVPGDEIKIRATPHRDRTFKFAHAVSVEDAFGTVYVMANSDRLFSPSLRRAAAAVGSDTVAAGEAAGVAITRELSGRWQQPLVKFAPEVPGLPLNEAGMAAWRNYDRERSPANTCEPINVPDLLSAPFFLLDLRVDEQHAVLRHEAYGVVRTVSFEGAAATEPTGRFGIANARIEGATLVIESRDYAPSAWGLGIEEMHGGGVIPSSERKTVVERFSVMPDGRTLVYAYVLYDAAYMTEPYEGRVELTRVPDDVELYEYPCDVESAALWSRQPADSPPQLEPTAR